MLQVEAVVSESLRHARQNKDRDRTWLFDLAGRLKAHNADDEATMVRCAESLRIAIVSDHSLRDSIRSSRIDWFDPASVELAAINALTLRKFGLHGDALNRAIQWSLHLGPELDRNRHVSHVAGIALYLHCLQNGETILLPVHQIAKGIGTTPATVSFAIKRLAKMGAVEIVNASSSMKDGRARILRFHPETLGVDCSAVAEGA